MPRASTKLLSSQSRSTCVVRRLSTRTRKPATPDGPMPTQMPGNDCIATSEVGRSGAGIEHAQTSATNHLNFMRRRYPKERRRVLARSPRWARYPRAMPLTARDLEAIRTIVRDELARALAARDDRAVVANADAEFDDNAMRQRVREDLAWLRRDAKERAARPIPNTPFVDRYDAARLLGVRMDTITNYTKRGLLTRHKVKGRLQISRAELDKLLAEGGRRR